MFIFEIRRESEMNNVERERTGFLITIDSLSMTHSNMTMSFSKSLNSKYSLKIYENMKNQLFLKIEFLFFFSSSCLSVIKMPFNYRKILQNEISLPCFLM